MKAMSESSRQSVQVGELLAGRYRVRGLIGEGAVGAVFLADDLEAGKQVAIKVLKRALFADPLATERFRREIRATMAIACEYVVRTLAVGSLDNGAAFMVMPYQDGPDLARAMAERGPLPVELAVEFGLELCVALAHAHRLGIVHRDIKPANLLLVRAPNGRERIKVLDFGISKFTSDLDVTTPERLTGNAVRLGSPLYMSPEQRNFARDVDERADIWSFGITLFEMIAGVVPFDSSPHSSRGETEIPSTVPSLSCYRPGIPQQLDWVIARCLQRMPSYRFQSVAELADVLRPFVAPQVGQLAREVANVLAEVGYSPPAGAGAPMPGPALEALRRETTVVASSQSAPDTASAAPLQSPELRSGTTLGPSIRARRNSALHVLAHRDLVRWIGSALVVGLALWSATVVYRCAYRPLSKSSDAPKLDPMPLEAPFAQQARTGYARPSNRPALHLPAGGTVPEASRGDVVRVVPLPPVPAASASGESSRAPHGQAPDLGY